MKRLLLMALILPVLAATVAHGQEATPRKESRPTCDSLDSVLQSSIFRFTLQPLQVKLDDGEHPQLDPTGVHFHDPLDALNDSYYLGIYELGHPHVDLFRDYSSGVGLGFRAPLFPAFYKQPYNVSFYQAKRHYTRLAAHGSLQKDYQLHVTHTQDVCPRWNVALDYHLFGSQGSLVSNSATDHLLDISTNYHSRDSRYNLVAGIIWQQMSLNESRTLATDTICSIDSLLRSLSRDFTVFAHQSYNTVCYSRLVHPRRQLTADDSGRLHDTIVGYDTTHTCTPRVFNSGVVAFDIQYDNQRYRCTDSILYRHLAASLYWTNDAYPDDSWNNPCKLTLGIRPEAERLELRNSTHTTHTSVMFVPFAQAGVALGEKTGLNIEGETSIATQEYSLTAGLEHGLGDDPDRRITIKAHTSSIGYDLIYDFVPAADTSTPLRNIDTRRLTAEYQGRHITLFVAGNHIAHSTWMNQQRQVVQSAGSAFLLQARLSGCFSFGSHLHFDMQQLAQYSSDQEQIRVPLFASKNSIYADFNLFHGALHTQVGVDLRYHTRFYADGYDPTRSLFYRQNEVEVGNYLYGDIFVNLQIKRASIYVKAGHLNSLIEQQTYCIHPHFPTRSFGVYFGLVWQFLH